MQERRGNSRADRTRRAIGEAISRAMAARSMTARGLADALITFDQDVDETKVRTWKQGKVRLPLHLAQPLARALGMTDDASDLDVVGRLGYDPLVMVRLFGLSPNDREADRLLAHTVDWPSDPTDRDVVDRLRVLERLELEVADYEELLAETEHHRAAQIVLQAVAESRTYGVAFWPVHAGPTDRPEHQLHVSDRVDIRRLDHRATTEKEVWADLGDALGHARALPSSSHPRWPGSDGLVLDPTLTMWNLRRLDVPRRPRVRHAHPQVPAIAFSATVSSSWVGNLASLVAMVLGYGVSSTIDLGRQLSGESHYKPDTRTRNQVHSELLRNPGERRVWFHAAKDDSRHPHSPWAPLGGRPHPELVHIHLCEDDELLAATADDRSQHRDFRPTVESEWRAARDRSIDTQPKSDRVLILPVEHAGWATTSKWDHTFRRVIAVLEFLDRLGLEPWQGLAAAQARWIDDDPGLTRPAMTWLREHRAPYVYEPTSIERAAPPRSRPVFTPAPGRSHSTPEQAILDDDWQLSPTDAGLSREHRHGAA